METFFAEYLNNLQELHDGIRAAVQGLPQSALDWTPGADTNSLNVLVVHLTGAERYWTSDVVAGLRSGRERDAEFKVRGLSGDDLLQRLGDIERFAQSTLETLTPQAVEAKRVSPRNGQEVTVAWALLHTLKHTALHLGHIELTRQLWERAQPDTSSGT